MSELEEGSTKEGVSMTNWSWAFALVLGFAPTIFIVTFLSLAVYLHLDSDRVIEIMLLLLFLSPVWLGGYSLVWSWKYSKALLGARDGMSVVGYALAMSGFNYFVAFAGCDILELV